MCKLIILIVYNYFFIRICRIWYVALTPHLITQDVIFSFNLVAENFGFLPHQVELLQN